ncbi:MAG TPA: YggS family pyridoxal phosphate-dependent enzyme [Candidatus Eubacterium faecavium]|nr:YggS family pyridoxal phosphate-dependent enzyme [Candidatus Eubacterium faecavium]
MGKYILDEERLKAVEDHYKRILENVKECAVRSGRDEHDVRLMCVTKTVEPPYINRALELGADLIGENRVQEFLGKKDELMLNGVEKHLIGHLQTNKVRQIVGEVDMIESVSSFKLAKEVARVSAARGVVTNCLAEVNIGQEESKSGIMPQELEETLFRISELPAIKIKGLMAIPPICDTQDEARRYFAAVRQYFIDIKDKKIDNINMEILSMGMSGDYEAAIAEGSNIVRIGSAIFGARKYN